MRTPLLPAISVLLLLLFALPQVVLAAPSGSPPPLPAEIPAALVRGGLSVSAVPTSFAPSRSPTEERLLLNITNPTGWNTTAGLYYLDTEVGAWRAIGEIGGIAAGETKAFEIVAKLAYTGEATTRGRYAVISEQLYSAEFEIFEDWSAYEARTATWMRYGSALLAPALALALIAAMFLFARAAQASPKFGAYPGEYTVRTLFRIPTGKGIGETFVLLLAHPIVWTFVAAFTAGTMALFITAHYVDLATAAQIGWLSFVLSAAVPAALLIVSWWADRFEREPARFVVGMFCWGIIAAVLSFIVSSVLTRGFAAAAPMSPELILFFSGLAIAPAVEEVVKGAGVFAMSRHHELDDTLDGLLYGFVIGLGFAAVENWYYAALRLDPFAIGLEGWAYSIAYRSLFNTLAHGCFTAFVGALIGAMKARPRYALHSALALAPGLLLAIILHTVFNAAALADIVMIGRLRFHVFNPLLVAIIVAGFIVVYYFASDETRKRMQAAAAAEAAAAAKR